MSGTASRAPTTRHVAIVERDERHVAIGRRQQGWDAKVVHPEHIYEARKGEKPRQVAVLDVDHRRTMEAEITNRAVEFIKRNAKRWQAVFCLRFVLVGSHADAAKSGVRWQNRQWRLG